MLGPADYFALAVLAFLAVATVLGSSPLRGLAALCLGLFLGLVGTDLLTGQQRFTFGIPQLADGIDVVDRRGRAVRGRRGAARGVPAAARAGRR